MTLPDPVEATDEEVVVFATRSRDLLYIPRRLVEHHRAQARVALAKQSPPA